MVLTLIFKSRASSLAVNISPTGPGLVSRPPDSGPRPSLVAMRFSIVSHKLLITSGRCSGSHDSLLTPTRVARQGAPHTRDRDVELPSNLAQRHPFVSQADDGLGIDRHAGRPIRFP